MWDTAIEELLRFYAPVTMARNATEDVEYGGVTFKKGDKILMNFPGANHDPDHFENPHEVQLDRQRNRHIAFGVGIHRCAGSNLARMEMEVALKTWFERIPEFTLSDPDAVTWAGGQVRGLVSSPSPSAKPPAALLGDRLGPEHPDGHLGPGLIVDLVKEFDGHAVDSRRARKPMRVWPDR